MDESIVIGLTGQTGAGKSTVAAVLSETGCAVIDADYIAREVIKEDNGLLFRLKEEFGDEIVDESGVLCRSILAKKAFVSKQKTKRLSEITHPFILSKIQKEIDKLQKKGIKIVLIDAPLLFESGADRFCDVVIAVLTNETVRMRRIIKRDHLSEEAAKSRMTAQNPENYYRTKADYLLDGGLCKEELCKKAKTLLSRIMEDRHEKRY